MLLTPFFWIEEQYYLFSNLYASVAIKLRGGIGFTL